MLVRLVLSLHRVALIAALTVALVATGFAHRIAAPQDEALAFALANGVNLSDICGDEDLGRSHASADCQACQIAGTAKLPPLIGASVDIELAFHTAVVLPREVRATLPVSDQAHRSQGPPVA